MGGRGANSSIAKKTERNKKSSSDSNKGITFDQLQKGDTFIYNNGTTEYHMEISGKSVEDYGYYIEGSGYVNGKRDNVSRYIGYLQEDSKIEDSQYQLPFSKITKLTRKIK